MLQYDIKKDEEEARSQAVIISASTVYRRLGIEGAGTIPCVVGINYAAMKASYRDSRGHIITNYQPHYSNPISQENLPD